MVLVLWAKINMHLNACSLRKKEAFVFFRAMIRVIECERKSFSFFLPSFPLVTLWLRDNLIWEPEMPLCWRWQCWWCCAWSVGSGMHLCDLPAWAVPWLLPRGGCPLLRPLSLPGPGNRLWFMLALNQIMSKMGRGNLSRPWAWQYCLWGWGSSSFHALIVWVRLKLEITLKFQWQRFGEDWLVIAWRGETASQKRQGYCCWRRKTRGTSFPQRSQLGSAPYGGTKGKTPSISILLNWHG